MCCVVLSQPTNGRNSALLAVVGNTQRSGVPMGHGGPHVTYFATKEDFKRQLPGRIIGVSIDRTGKRALRMALQTREQRVKPYIAGWLFVWRENEVHNTASPLGNCGLSWLT